MFNKKYFIVVVFLIQILLMHYLNYFSSLVETYYSNRLFLWSSQFFRFLFGKIPFSVGDILYLFVILYALYLIWKTKRKWKLHWKSYVLKLTNVLSISYFLFHLLWGFNYYRQPLFEKMHLKKEYNSKELYAFTEKLIAKTNAIQFAITKNKNRKV